MDESKPLIEVSLTLYGDSLDPHYVTSMLGTTPSKTRLKGEKRKVSTDKEVIAKTGIWALTLRKKSNSLSGQISALRREMSSAKCSPIEIQNVEHVEVSVFIALGLDESDYESTINSDDLDWLGQLGARLSFYVTCISDPISERTKN